jgi:hypothetical protein
MRLPARFGALAWMLAAMMGGCIMDRDLCCDGPHYLTNCGSLEWGVGRARREPMQAR